MREMDAPVELPQPAPEPAFPAPQVELATVCIIDGIWQDQPDHVAAFVEERLGELARGRGNLYLLLDVSGEIEGRAELERALIEVMRDAYANSRGSISFALSEALRAGNAHLYESNRQVAREARRMAGISAVVLRGGDLYIAQAGPAVVYVEAGEKLQRYPNESDWFVEDAPLFAPEGAASPPLGVRREFTCDLAHAALTVGDVFVLATRGLTQLASTAELAVAFSERSAREIAGFLEGLGEDGDLTALVVELITPHGQPPRDGGDKLEDEEIEAQEDAEPAVAEPQGNTVMAATVAPPPTEIESQHPKPVANPDAQEYELNWNEEDVDEQAAGTENGFEPAAPEPQTAPLPVYRSAAVRLERATLNPPRVEPPMPPPPSPPPVAQELDPEELERVRVERQARRAAQRESVSRAVGGVTSVFGLMLGALGSLGARTFGAVDWEAVGAGINRTLNRAVSGLISLFLLMLRLVLPGAPPRQSATMPRRATDDPIWLKAMAFVLPVVFVVLAGARYVQQINFREAQFKTLVSQADTLVRQAESNPDKAQARKQLADAGDKLKQAAELGDSPQARAIANKVQDQNNELDGISVIYFLKPFVEFDPPSQLAQIAASESDVFILDRGRKQILHYAINDTTGTAKAATGDAGQFKVNDKIDNYTIGDLRLITMATPTEDLTWLVAVTDSGIVWYDLKSGERHAQPVDDAGGWGDLRAIDSYGGTIYILDAAKNQIYKYVHTDKGYASKAAPYFPTNTQINLSRAVDMAIDGDVWILNRNSTIQRFRAGVPVAFQLTGLKTPLKNPTAIYTRPEVDALYIADSGNRRVVVFDKNGRFTAEFKPYSAESDRFSNLQDLTVNDAKRKMYLVNDRAALLASVVK